MEIIQFLKKLVVLTISVLFCTLQYLKTKGKSSQTLLYTHQVQKGDSTRQREQNSQLILFMQIVEDDEIKITFARLPR